MIRPVEFQGVVQRGQDMATVNQNENNKTFINHENVLTQTKKEIEVKIRDVNNKDNADNHAKNPDAKEKGNGSYEQSGDKKQKKKQKNEDKVMIKGQTHGFDIKI